MIWVSSVRKCFFREETLSNRQLKVVADNWLINRSFVIIHDGNYDVLSEYYDGNIYSQSRYWLRTHLGKLHEGSAVCNTALMRSCSWGQRTVQARLTESTTDCSVCNYGFILVILLQEQFTEQYTIAAFIINNATRYHVQ